MILLTRTVKDNNLFQQKLYRIGLISNGFPCIKIIRTSLNKRHRGIFKKINQFDWIIFTSSNAVIQFIEHMESLGITKDILWKISIAVVGIQTKRTVKYANLSIDFMPSSFTDQTLGEELPDISNKRILIPRSKNADNKLPRLLEKRGGIVTTIPLYATHYYPENNIHFSDLLQKGISCITFTSGSCVYGFMKKVTDDSLRKKAFELPVISIGPSTTKVAKELGFSTIITSNMHTIDGMIETLVKFTKSTQEDKSHENEK